MSNRMISRIRRGFVALVLVALVFGLGGCFPEIHVLTEVDDGSLVVIDTGDTVEIRLPGNATTGFLWGRVAPTELCGTALSPIEEGAYSDDSTAMGSPGTFVFRYRAADAGTVRLTLAYRRPWETDPPLETFTITVWVR